MMCCSAGGDTNTSSLMYLGPPFAFPGVAAESALDVEVDPCFPDLNGDSVCIMSFASTLLESVAGAGSKTCETCSTKLVEAAAEVLGR